jgi:3-hydroxybutyryl-CoA dehydratase
MAGDDSQRGAAAVSQGVDQAVIDRYATLSGDFNPLHVDPEAAARSEFGSTIAHGPIALQTFFVAATRKLGSEALPPGAKVAVTYRYPVRPGDEVSCHWLAEPEPDGPTAEVRNQDGTVVVTITSELDEGAAR